MIGPSRKANLPRECRDRCEGQNSITRKTVEQSFVYHDLGAAEILFRRLENQMNGSVEIAPLSQSLGSTEQHGRMAIMSTGMHQTRDLLE